MDNQEFVIKLGTAGLTRLLRGGFTLPHDASCGLVILIRGKAGTGKSTLALQILDEMESRAPKYYCTLEQTTLDLRFKLAAMLVAQAIDKARRPDFKAKEFTCDWRLFVNHLKGKIRANHFDEAAAQQSVSQITLPLYDDPGDKRPDRNKGLQEQLTNLVAQDLNTERIQMPDQTPDPAREGPFKAFQNRVVLASSAIGRMIDEFRQHPGEGSERSNRPVAVVDGLSLLSVSERETLELQQIVERLRRLCQVGIVVYEPNENESTCLDHHADMVIELTRRQIEHPLSYLIHELCIRKSRYQEAALGQHQFKIRGSGIALFPSLHFQVHHHNYMELELNRSSSEHWEPTKRPPVASEGHEGGSLIDMIFSPQDGDSTVLLGSRNSFKTQFCLDFLSRGDWGCPKRAPVDKRERGLLVSLIDNAPDIQQGLICPWKKTMRPSEGNECGECALEALPHARPFCQRPGCITPSEYFYYLKERIDAEHGRLKRLVFWDLTQMDYRFPLFRDDKMLLPAMMDLFKTKKLRSLLMGAGNADNTSAASAMTDHVLFCWRSAHVPKQFDDKVVSSLMLYVDRTSASSQQSGKALYCIPVYEHDRIAVPATREMLDNAPYRLDPNYKKLKDSDKEQIKRITAMQGVA